MIQITTLSKNVIIHETSLHSHSYPCLQERLLKKAIDKIMKTKSRNIDITQLICQVKICSRVSNNTRLNKGW